MRTHTNNFKNEISKLGRVLSFKVYHYLNYDLISESNDTLITEDNIKLISEQINLNDKELIDEELIYSMSIIKNGQLLHSLMKEFDFEARVELRVGDIVNPHFGVYTNADFEYLNYGNFIIYSKEYNVENDTWNYVCYDKMLLSMVQYKPLDLIYPCTISDYMLAICNRIGLEFANAGEQYTNYNQIVYDELFEGQNITYRDVLDKLSEITASNLYINDNDELELGYPNETNDVIDEDDLSDTNINFGEMFGPINKVSIVETDGGYEYSAEDSQSIEVNGLTQLNITDNLFAFNEHSDQIAQNILNKVNGLYYSINDFKTTGLCYYDYLDVFNVNIGENSYKCLLLNNEIKFNQGIEETIFTEPLENSEKESNNFKVSDISNKEVQFKINKQKGEISSKVEKDGVISSINQSAEEVQIDARKISLKGKTIDMTVENIKIQSDNFNVNEQGNCVANSFSSNNATITGGSLNITANTGADLIKLKDNRNNCETKMRGSEVEIVRGTNSTILSETGIDIVSNGESSYLETAGLVFNHSYGASSYTPAQWRLKSSTGETRCDAGSTPYVVSDKRFKNNIKNIDRNKSINIIKALNPVEYTLKNQEKVHRGLIAQEVVEVLNKNGIKNQIYDINENGYYMLGYTELIPDLINCIKYQQEQIENLQDRIEKLEKEVR